MSNKAENNVLWTIRPSDPEDIKFVTKLYNQLQQLRIEQNVVQIAFTLEEFNTTKNQSNWKASLRPSEKIDINMLKFKGKISQSYKAFNLDNNVENYDGRITITLKADYKLSKTKARALLQLALMRYYIQTHKSYPRWITHYLDAPHIDYEDDDK